MVGGGWRLRSGSPAVAGPARATTWAYAFDSGSVPRVLLEIRSMPCRYLHGELARSNDLPRRIPSAPVSYSSTAPRSAWEQALCMTGVARRYLDAYEPTGKLDGRHPRQPAAAQHHRDAAERSERSAPRRGRMHACRPCYRQYTTLYCQLGRSNIL